MIVLLCRKCGVGYADVGEIPPICPACEQPTSWTTAPDTPRVAWRLTRADRRFLKVNKIDPEAEPETSRRWSSSRGDRVSGASVD